MMDSSHPKYAQHLENLKTWQGLPVTVGDLERIIGAARTMPGDIDGIPAAKWWPALVLTMIDSAESLAALLDLPATAYDRDKGELRIGHRTYRLHAHTANALEALRPFDREYLFPWALDGGNESGGPFFMVYRGYQDLLHRAGLPPLQKRPLPKLKRLGERYPEVLDCIDPNRPFHPVQGKPQRNRKRKPKRRKPRQGHDVYVIQDHSPDALKRFFLETYVPVKLVGCSERTKSSHWSAINGFSSFLGCDASLHHLTDDKVSAYKNWMANRNYEPATINNHLRHLLALWRLAYRKCRKDVEPRDVFLMTEVKRIPEAWSLDELGQILNSALNADGEIYGVPTKLFFPALISFIYDTGLRIGAVMLLETKDFNFQTGEVLIHGENQKQLADQVFEVHPQTLEWIREIHAERREYLFNSPHFGDNRFNRTILYRTFDRILTDAGLPSTARDKLHKIRRTSATYLCDAMGSAEAASKHLGHSSVTLTINHYIDPSKLAKRTKTSTVLKRPPLNQSQP